MIAMKLIAAIACALMAWMAAGDATKARERSRPAAFAIFMIFAMLFAAAFVWVILLPLK